MLLLNPNYSATAGVGGNRNRRPSRRKKPKINVIEGGGMQMMAENEHDEHEDQESIHPLPREN